MEDLRVSAGALTINTFWYLPLTKRKTGGQDDLVSLWSVRDRQILARCQGHQSWVSGVAFDPYVSSSWRNIRFSSVGEDGRLLLWDYSTNTLHRPKVVVLMSNNRINGDAVS